MKILIITCYNQPDYIRAQTLRVAVGMIDNAELIVIKNSYAGLLRYVEVFWKVLKARFLDKPDVYLLTFRGYEMLLPIRLISIGKKLIYDEFVNPIEWVVLERRQVEAKQKSNRIYAILVSFTSKFIVFIVSSRLFKYAYKRLALSADLILSDTNSHAEASAAITKIEPKKIMGLFVGTDEAMFTSSTGIGADNKEFTVFYYGNMLPLHGLGYVIDAATKMNGENIKFVLVGGNAKVANDVAMAVADGANIEYHAWVNFDQLPKLVNEADVCLAGPFGNTFQAQYVITGKTYQYLAMSRPTIVGANEESHNFLDKKNVLIVPQADSDALVEAIRWASTHPKELRVLGEGGRWLYEKEFSTERIAARLREALVLVGFTEFGSSAEREQNKK